MVTNEQQKILLLSMKDWALQAKLEILLNAVFEIASTIHGSRSCSSCSSSAKPSPSLSPFFAANILWTIQWSKFHGISYCSTDSRISVMFSSSFDESITDPQHHRQLQEIAEKKHGVAQVLVQLKSCIADATYTVPVLMIVVLIFSSKNPDHH